MFVSEFFNHTEQMQPMLNRPFLKQLLIFFAHQLNVHQEEILATEE